MFRIPEKLLKSPEDMQRFERQGGFKDFFAFIGALANACKATRMSDTPLTENVTLLYEWLGDALEWNWDTSRNYPWNDFLHVLCPHNDQREYCTKLYEFSQLDEFERCIPEIRFYWEQSFGKKIEVNYREI